MYLFIKKYLFIFFIFTFAITCYEQRLKINNDNNSGIIDLKIILNNDFKNFLLFLNEESKKRYDKFLILEDKKELLTSLGKNKEATLLSYSKSKIDEDSIEYFISISLNKITEISDLMPNSYFPTKIIVKDDIVTVITSLDLSDYIDFSKLSLNEQSNIYVYSQFITLKFVYTVPGRITNIKTKNLNMEYLSKDLKEISFTTTLHNIIKNKGENEINFNYVYKKNP